MYTMPQGRRDRPKTKKKCKKGKKKILKYCKKGTIHGKEKLRREVATGRNGRKSVPKEALFQKKNAFVVGEDGKGSLNATVPRIAKRRTGERNSEPNPEKKTWFACEYARGKAQSG